MGGGRPENVLPVFDFKEMHAVFAVRCMGDPFPETVSEETGFFTGGRPFPAGWGVPEQPVLDIRSKSR